MAAKFRTDIAREKTTLTAKLVWQEGGVESSKPVMNYGYWMRPGQVPTLLRAAGMWMRIKTQRRPGPPQNTSGRGRHKDSKSGPGTLRSAHLTTLGKCPLGKEGWWGREQGENSRGWWAQLHAEGAGAHTLASVFEVCWLGERPGHGFPSPHKLAA